MCFRNQNNTIQYNETTASEGYVCCERRRTGSLAPELLRLSIPSGKTRLSPDKRRFWALSSGENGFSPDKTLFELTIFRHKPLVKTNKVFPLIRSIIPNHHQSKIRIKRMNKPLETE